MTLISDEYKAQIRQMHQKKDWGKIGEQFAEAAAEIAKREGLKSILDYGCGKGRFADAMRARGYEVTNYDPAMPEFAAHPEPHEFVTSFDVLEHIEPEHLEAVLVDLANLTQKLGMFTVATRPAAKHLPDGRNAHLIVEAMPWWIDRLSKHFRIAAVPGGDERQFVAFVEPK